MGLKESFQNGMNKIPPFRQFQDIRKSLRSMESIQQSIEAFGSELDDGLQALDNSVAIFEFEINDKLDDIQFSQDRRFASLKLRLIMPTLSEEENAVASSYMTIPLEGKNKKLFSITDENVSVEEIPEGFDIRHEAAISESLDRFPDQVERDSIHLTSLYAAKAILEEEMRDHSGAFTDEEKTARLRIINARIDAFSDRIPPHNQQYPSLTE